jgi:membrane-associated protein
MGLIIFLESIIYVGFYLPGQLIAVILVISGADSWLDLIPLTFVSLIAVILAASVNYTLGSLLSRNTGQKVRNPIDWKKLLISMIHINTLALALFEAGKNYTTRWVIGLTGILNIPYYTLILIVTFLFQESIREV